MSLLGRRQLLETFEELDKELKILDVRGENFFVGGVAMAIAFGAPREGRHRCGRCLFQGSANGDPRVR